MRGGARVGAGRKAHLEDSTVEQILRLSASTILKALRSDEIKLEVRADLASRFIVKKVKSADLGINGHIGNTIYIIAGNDKDVPKDLLEVFPSQLPADNQKIQE